MANEDPAVTIRRLRQRLYMIEPVYRAAVALHRVSARELSAQEKFDAKERIERAVDRALENERLLAEGASLSVSDAILESVAP